MEIPRAPTAEWQTVVDVLRWRAAQQSDRLALAFLGEQDGEIYPLHYGELDRRARQVAAALQERGAQGERAILVYAPGLDFITSFLGCLYAGVIAVPTDVPRPRRPARRITSIVANAQPRFLLTTALVGEVTRQTHPELTDADYAWLRTDQLEAGSENAWKEEPITGDTVALLQYTSGSLGEPKGSVISHSNLLENSKVIGPRFAHTSESSLFTWLPHFHDMGLIGGLLHPLLEGFPVAHMSPLTFLRKPHRWLEAISRFRAATSGAPNFAYEMCVRRITPEQKRNLDLSSWKVAFTGSEPVRAATIDRFVEAFAPVGFRREAFYPCYGMSEATLYISGGAASEPPRLIDVPRARIGDRDGDPTGTSRIVSCGRIAEGHRVEVVDPESGERVPEGETGEIWIAGPSIARGYWGRDDLSEHVFGARVDGRPERYLRTGDLGFVKAGEIFIAGRLKEVIIVAGMKHYPSDIESSVEECHPWLQPGNVVAFAVDTGDEEQLVVAVEIGRELWSELRGAPPIPQPLWRRWLFGRRNRSVAPNVRAKELRERIAGAVSLGHGLNVRWVVILPPRALERTTSGKIRRRKCEADFSLAATRDAFATDFPVLVMSGLSSSEEENSQ